MESNKISHEVMNEVWDERRKGNGGSLSPRGREKKSLLRIPALSTSKYALSRIVMLNANVFHLITRNDVCIDHGMMV